ncbi:hypothetical protein AJ88_46200 [Mesorhizobium amorphae CCBAU 01583]|nr:hypothetical protein AJ88_46200 [Mesorhizobium amorphae CCBAU 01583]
MPADERAAIERHLGLIDQINEALTVVEADIAVHALQDPTIRRLMTLPGIDVTVAASVAAAIGDIRRFSDPQKLVAYLGLNPSVRQSGEGPAYHGRITKQGRGHARGMLVEAAWAAARSPGPLRAFYKRIASRRGKHIAAVATARKLAMIIWHMLSKGTLHLGPAGLARPQVQIGRAACRPSDQPCQARHRLRLQHPGQARRRTISGREGGSCLCSSDFPMANEAGEAEGCGKSCRMRRRGYSTTSVCIGFPGAM